MCLANKYRKILGKIIACKILVGKYEEEKPLELSVVGRVILKCDIRLL
jgi:hypothetical protein